MAAKLNLFKKYLISFLLIFMIPVSCVVATLFSVGYDIFSKELYTKEIANINLSISHLNNELDECIFIAHHLTNKDAFTPFDLRANPSNGSRLVSTLFNYVISNKRLSEAIVYFDDSDYLYTSKTSLTSESFYSQFTAPSYPGENFKTLLKNVSEPTLINDLSYKNHEYFALVVPLASYYQRIGIGLFLFEKNAFYESLLPIQDKNRHFYFLNQLNLEVDLDRLNLGYLPSLNKESLLHSLSTLTQVEDSFSLNSDDYLLYATKPSPFADNLILLSTISHTEVFQPLNNLTIILITSLVGAIIFSLLCSYYVVKRNFEPLSELSYSLTLLKQDYSNLQKEVKKSIPMQQYFFLNQLINGNVNNIPDFIENCKSLNIDLSSPYHGIIVIKSQTAHFNLDKTIIETIESMQQLKVNQAYLIQHIHANIHIFLIGTQTNINLSSLVLPQSTLYFGSFSRRLSNISKSYISARTVSAFENFLPEGSDSLQVLFQDYKATILQLTTFLQVKDYAKIPELILHTIHSLESTTLPFPLQKIICVEIMLAFNNYINKQDEPIPYDKLDLVALFKVESFDALKEIVLEVSTEMLDLIIDYHHTRIPEPSLTLIKDFIKAHYGEENLSVEQIALHFALPPIYIEDYFYKHTTETPLDYIDRLRVKYAKELLITTPYSLKIIADQVGFTHISSFISSFKE
ncbi:MAG: helix-turn-helix transcriptional regulator, partial [Niameybacter sp.]